MTKNLFVIALATMLLIGCGTTGRTGKSGVEDPAAIPALDREEVIRAVC